MRELWDRAYLRGEHVAHWEDPSPPLHLAALLAAGVIPHRATVLDVGCGGGLQALAMASWGLRVVGVDLSPAALAVARRRGRGAGTAPAWIAGNALRLPLAGSSVDFACDHGCLHLFEERETRDLYAAELARVLRPGASLVVLGARQEDDERGLSAVDRGSLERSFVPVGLHPGPLLEVDLAAPAGDLAGHLVVLVRSPGG